MELTHIKHINRYTIKITYLTTLYEQNKGSLRKLNVVYIHMFNYLVLTCC